MSLRDLVGRATPGPWRFQISVGDEWWFGGWRDDGSRGQQATIRTDERKHDAVAVLGCNSDAEKADARLISLAPELALLAADLADALESSKSYDENDAALIARFRELEQRTNT